LITHPISVPTLGALPCTTISAKGLLHEVTDDSAIGSVMGMRVSAARVSIKANHPSPVISKMPARWDL
jgi:hypothetical protein